MYILAILPELPQLEQWEQRLKLALQLLDEQHLALVEQGHPEQYALERAKLCQELAICYTCFATLYQHAA